MISCGKGLIERPIWEEKTNISTMARGRVNIVRCGKGLKK